MNAGGSKSLTRRPLWAAFKAPCDWNPSRRVFDSILLQASSWRALNTNAVDSPSLQIEKERKKIIEEERREKFRRARKLKSTKK